MSITKPIAVLTLLVAVGVAGVFAAGEKQPPTGAAPPAAQPNPDPKMPQFLECAKVCDDCGRACDTCGAHCANLMAEGQKQHLQTLRTCQDCAAICSSASCVVAKSGPFSDLVCTACAEACKRCAEACQKHAEHDPIMKQCADECKRCEKSCRDMLKGIVRKGETPQK
jgi:hypothetical protein